MPTRSAFKTKAPVSLTVPPVTLSPVVFSAGIGSPVIMDSSIVLAAFGDLAVDGDFLAGPDAHEVAEFNLVHRHVLFPPFAQTARGLRGEVEEGADGGAGAGAGAQLRGPGRARRGR